MPFVLRSASSATRLLRISIRRLKMASNFVHLHLNEVNDGVVCTTVAALNRGEIVAVPTDTVYGLAVLAQNSCALRSLYRIKQRNEKKPIAICVGEIADIAKWAEVCVPRKLLEDLLPGPVTLVFERSQNLNAELNPQTTLVGVRIPNHSFIRDLANAAGGPLALTSANVSDTRSSLCIEEFKELWPKLSVVVDGGRLSNSEECRSGSTVVDLSKANCFSIIRPGNALQATRDILVKKYAFLEIRKCI